MREFQGGFAAAAAAAKDITMDPQAIVFWPGNFNCFICNLCKERNVSFETETCKLRGKL